MDRTKNNVETEEKTRIHAPAMKGEYARGEEGEHVTAWSNAARAALALGVLALALAFIIGSRAPGPSTSPTPTVPSVTPMASPSIITPTPTPITGTTSATPAVSRPASPLNSTDSEVQHAEAKAIVEACGSSGECIAKLDDRVLELEPMAALQACGHVLYPKKDKEGWGTCANALHSRFLGLHPEMGSWVCDLVVPIPEYIPEKRGCYNEFEEALAALAREDPDHVVALLNDDGGPHPLVAYELAITHPDFAIRLCNLIRDKFGRAQLTCMQNVAGRLVNVSVDKAVEACKRLDVPNSEWLIGSCLTKLPKYATPENYMKLYDVCMTNDVYSECLGFLTLSTFTFNKTFAKELCIATNSSHSGRYRWTETKGCTEFATGE